MINSLLNVCNLCNLILTPLIPKRKEMEHKKINREMNFDIYLHCFCLFKNSYQLKDVPFLEEGTKTVDTLATLMLTGCTTHQIAEIIMQCQPLRNAIKFFFLKDVNEQCQKLCNRSAENSSLLCIPPSKHKVIILLLTTL